jgi:RNA polymerase sigma-70 factor (ECF subfamily)
MSDPYLNVLSDEQLVQLAIKDERIYEVLIDRYRRPLRTFIYSRFVHDNDQLDDIVQESFVRAYYSLNTFNLTMKWKTWLYRIALNLVFTMIKKPQTLTLEENLNGLESDAPEKIVENNLRKEKVEEVLGLMDPKYSLVLVMHYQKEQSLEEISKALNMKILQVKSRLEYARKLFAISFEV